MTQNPQPDPDPKTDWADWLRSPVTLRAPRWVFLAGAAGAILLLLIALD